MTTRSTTSSARATCRRCSSRARRSAEPSISTALTDIGVRLSGRLAGIRDGKAQFSGSLRNQCALADLKMDRLLDRSTSGPPRTASTARSTRRTASTDRGSKHRRRSRSISRTAGSEPIIWATGFRPDYSWLDVPVLDRKGSIRHDGGVVEAPGMYLMGMPFLRRRKSTSHRRRRRRRARLERASERLPRQQKYATHSGDC